MPWEILERPENVSEFPYEPLLLTVSSLGIYECRRQNSRCLTEIVIFQEYLYSDEINFSTRIYNLIRFYYEHHSNPPKKYNLVIHKFVRRP